MQRQSRNRASQDSRTAILAGAGRAFGRLGYGTCRVEDIIEEAGVSRGTFYKFFDSKEAVFESIEQAFDLSFVQAMQSVDDPRLSPQARAEAYLDAYLRWIVGWRDLARTMWTDPTRPGAETLNQVRNDALTAFIGLVAGLVNDMGIPEADPMIYRGILGAVSEIGMSVVEQPRLTDNELIRARKAIIHIITASLTPPTDAPHPIPTQ
ncbi:MAG TPA: TetR/AcrR family transcriptional regulator [Actinomycetota bacterium]|nr:TetR/AcrR family transcriptional regulator [Actinomycetota bacterium]